MYLRSTTAKSARFGAQTTDEQGIAVLLLVVTLGLVAVAVIYFIAADSYSVNVPEVTARQQKYLAQAVQKLNRYYRANAWALSQGSTFPVSSKSLLTQADIIPEYNVQVCISNRKTFGTYQIPYYDIWIYTPSRGGGNEPTCSDGNFVANGAQASTLYSGEEAQSALLSNTENQLNRLGTLLVQGAAAAVQGGASHDEDVDYFLSQQCSPNGSGNIACAGSWSDTSGAGLSSLIGSAAAFEINAWGQPIQYSNESPNADDAQPPYTISLRTELPGGQYLQETFDQPDS
ncbi:hypothetical protein HAQ00_02300 [Acidithiobacillus caldus ATCC 51756]|uniref:hypothetical protein n=1 Tax=Acidithiobacillus caldus TaxID=33059 RepID=UPI001C06A780|nr:hypothetical protein [Acidithiobacillus caldus]MBU2734576.1 hypothetical protein [Acidithiobacillus caldus ATCC 51756]MBU2801321.1 hypothetical protein [Acidithiobacillus caldus]